MTVLHIDVHSAALSWLPPCCLLLMYASMSTASCTASPCQSDVSKCGARAGHVPERHKRRLRQVRITPRAHFNSQSMLMWCTQVAEYMKVGAQKACDVFETRFFSDGREYVAGPEFTAAGARPDVGIRLLLAVAGR